MKYNETTSLERAGGTMEEATIGAISPASVFANKEILGRKSGEKNFFCPPVPHVPVLGPIVANGSSQLATFHHDLSVWAGMTKFRAARRKQG